MNIIIGNNMKYLRLFILMSMLLYVQFSYTQTNSQNYIKTVTPVSAISNDNAVDNSNKITSLQYFDGLGRPVLHVTDGVNTSGKYVYSFKTYNTNGLEDETWMPIVGTESPVFEVYDDLHRMSYNSYGDGCVFFKNMYDGLGRVISSFSPGEQWKNKGKAKRKHYITNCEKEVKKYVAPLSEISLQYVGFYPAGSLTGETFEDEDGHKLTVFMDFMGKKILERRNDNNDTYFVYNDLGQLRYVLSPEYQKSGYKALYAYEYRYDSHGNIVKKILPGCDVIQYWYDADDRLVFEQDATLRANNIYRFWVYDSMGRMAVQGTCSDCLRNGLVNTVSFTTTVTDSPLGDTGYVLSDKSQIVNPKIELVCYYDMYDFLSLYNSASDSFTDNLMLTNYENASGLQTGCVQVVGNGERMLSVLYYDIDERITDYNFITLGKRLIKNHYEYNFLGNRTKVTTHEYKKTKTSLAKYLTTIFEYKYDAKSGLLISCDLTVSPSEGNPVKQTFQTFKYNDLGQVISLIRGAQAGKVNYSYTIQGWVQSIESTAFSERLHYHDGVGTPCYNGNISSLYWTTPDYNKTRGYKFIYDNLNRLEFAEYGERESMTVNPNRYDEKVLKYTENGAVKRFQRRGLKDDNVYGKIDNLHIELNGNRITKVDDDAVPLFQYSAMDFVDTNTDIIEYTYNGAGALTSDANRGIASIEYDNLNHPVRITFTNGNTIKHVYSPDGTKLRTVWQTAIDNIVVPVGGCFKLSQNQILHADSTDYCGNAVYHNGVVDKYLFDGGYCTFSGGTPKFHYYTKDHLGNNRAVVSESGTIEQLTHYYPFGGVITDISTNQSLQPYKYNGKELDRMHGWDKYDYGARLYDPILTVWTSIDPLCEKYYHLSPYAHCGGNPINRIDLHGDSITILDMASIDAIYNALQPGTNLSMKFNNGILIPESIRQTTSNSQDIFLQDLYNISINSQMVEIATTNTNDYYIGDEFHSDIWSAPSDIDYAKDFNNGQKTELYPAGRTIFGNLGQTLYPISSSEYKRATNGNIRININGMGNINQRSCSIAHEFGHVILYLNGQPHGHSNNSDFIFGRQWNVMKRFGYDYLESLTGKIFK